MYLRALINLLTRNKLKKSNRINDFLSESETHRKAHGFFFLKKQTRSHEVGLNNTLKNRSVLRYRFQPAITAEDVIIKELKVFFLFGLLQVVESSQKRI